MATWRSMISGVFQDFGQYHFTIGENIALGEIQPSLERVSQAVYKGGFSPVLERLPAGFNALLGKEFGGTALRRRVAETSHVTRFFREAKLLILDEPTSALDPQSEHEVFKTFAEQAEGKTTVLITHRLGSVKMADRILVFKKGELIEEGVHHDLLLAKGEYAALFLTQAEQYKSSFREPSCAI